MGIALLYGCSVPYTAIDYDRSFDFQKVKTYGYSPFSAWDGMSHLQQRRFQEVLEENLKSKGWEKTENPQVLISVYSEFRTTENTTQLGIETGGYMGSVVGGIYMNIPIPVKKHFFEIHISDAHNGNLLWQGIYYEEISRNRELNNSLVTKVVTRLMKKFPPKKIEKD